MIDEILLLNEKGCPTALPSRPLPPCEVIPDPGINLPFFPVFFRRTRSPPLC